MFLWLGNLFVSKKGKVFFLLIISLFTRVFNVPNITTTPYTAQIIFKIWKTYNILKEFLTFILWAVKKLHSYVFVTDSGNNYSSIKLDKRDKILKNKKNSGLSLFAVIFMKSNKNIKKQHKYDFYSPILKIKY